MENISGKRTCQNCKKDFTIEPDDFGFYEKIKVPPPTFCPRCRAVRRMTHTNERVLYKRKCDLTGAQIFSMYGEGTPFPVYETTKWYSDEWDPYKYGMEYDFSKPFFEQFKELQNKVPHMALVRQGFATNSEYTHRVTDMKNSYMVFRMTRAEDSFYSYIGKDLVDSSDCFAISNVELCYECIDSNNCYRVRFGQECNDCRESMFLYACRNCVDCIGCVNLINKQYHIWNQPYTKEEYFKKLTELKLNTYSGIEKIKIDFEEFRKKFPQRGVMSLKSNNVSGNWFTNCENVKNSFWCLDLKDCKYIYYCFSAEDCMDFFQWGNSCELIYESENCGINSSRIYFCTQCWTGAHDLLYCDSCPSSGNCFGCIGLKKGEYAILNKKYTKEEYEKLLPKITEHMQAMPYIDHIGNSYGYGEHFPSELSPFSYNETAAIDFFPLSKEEALKQGFKWKDKEKNTYQTTMKSTDLPETIADTDDSILDQVIECGEADKAYSVGAYRITKNELNFYRRMDLPLPHSCFQVRHTNRLNKRPPLNIIKRSCKKCATGVETVYTEEYAPVIYCEKCYKEEVY